MTPESLQRAQIIADECVKKFVHHLLPFISSDARRNGTHIRYPMVFRRVFQKERNQDYVPSYEGLQSVVSRCGTSPVQSTSGEPNEYSKAFGKSHCKYHPFP